MTEDRWVVLGLGHPRAAWFSDVARWSTSAALPLDFVKCVSAGETRARLRSGRVFSALLAGADVGGLDRDLIDAAADAGAVVITVDSRTGRDWIDLGAAAQLPDDFDRDALLAVLRTHAPAVARVTAVPPVEADEPEPATCGRLIAVTGPGGSGTSVVAMAAAQSLAPGRERDERLVLADLRLDAELAMLHDAREVMPAVQELTDAHRGGRLSVEQVRSLCFDVAGRDYELLLGLRRHRDWTAIRPRAFAAALDGLMRSYAIIIADVDPDIEGEDSTGSLDVEDRNAIARTTLARADLVVVVGNPSTKGLHSLTRVVRDLHRGGIGPARMIPVLNRAPKSPRRRSEAARTLDVLLGHDDALADIGNPVFLAERNDVDDAIRDGVALPSALGRPLQISLRRALGDIDRGADAVDGHAGEGPTRVVPGSIGSWTEEVA